MDPWRMQKFTLFLISVVLYGAVVSIITKDSVSLTINLASLCVLFNPIIRD